MNALHIAWLAREARERFDVQHIDDLTDELLEAIEGPYVDCWLCGGMGHEAYPGQCPDLTRPPTLTVVS